MIMGAEEGTRGMMWEEIEEGADKLRVEGGDICKTSASRKRKREGGLRGNDAMKVAYLARGQDDCHSHACILPECGMFCTPELVVRARKKDTIRFRLGCRVAKKRDTVSVSICVATVTKQPHSARRRCVPISLAHDRRNFANIFTPIKVQ